MSSSASRIVIEGEKDALLHCWSQSADEGFDRCDPNSLFLSKETKITLDGFISAISYDESGSECIVATTSGSIWFASWLEGGHTVKIKSCHSPLHEIKCLDYKYLPPN